MAGADEMEVVEGVAGWVTGIGITGITEDVEVAELVEVCWGIVVAAADVEGT